MDPKRRQLHFKSRPPLRYDVLSVDIGITPGRSEVQGAEEHATPVKPIDG